MCLYTQSNVGCKSTSIIYLWCLPQLRTNEDLPRPTNEHIVCECEHNDKKAWKTDVNIFSVTQITKYTHPCGRYGELSSTGMLLCSTAEQFSFLVSKMFLWVYASAAKPAKLLVKMLWFIPRVLNPRCRSMEFKYNVSRLKLLQRPPPEHNCMPYFICITCWFSFWIHFPFRPSGCAGKKNNPSFFVNSTVRHTYV